MIKLHSRHCLVAAPDGTVRSLDVEALRRNLRRSFRSCGVSEDWTADHIALVIEEHAAGTSTDRPPLAERDLHAMVSALLAASGYEDVGRHYRDLVPAAADCAAPDPFRAWDQARIEAELSALLPVDESERQGIVARTASALAMIGLTAVRSELIRELGQHVLRRVVDERRPGAADSPWLLRPDEWTVAAVPDAARLVAAGALCLHPVSRFLPRIRLELDLRRLATLAATPPLPEIILLPALAHGLDAIAGLIAQTRRALADRGLQGVPPTAHLGVAGLDETVAEAVLPQSARAAKALRHEIEAIVTAKLPVGTERAALVTFR